MRIYFLPISTRRTLIYCEPLAHLQPLKKRSYLDRAVGKANETWLSWEKDPKSVLDWKRRVTTWGNALFRRIPHEEWGLKSIPPMKLAERRRWWELGEERMELEGKEAVELLRAKKVEVRYPAQFQGLCKGTVLERLRELGSERAPLHRKRLRWSLVAMPVTLPIGILPVIPNIPFFYAAFRAYSHWRALLGIHHLNHLLDNDMLRPTPFPALDNLYTLGLLHPNRDESVKAAQPSTEETKRVVQLIKQQTNGDAEEILLLHEWNAKVIAERLGFPSLETEIERAVEQVKTAMDKGGAMKDESEMMGEKKELEMLRRPVTVDGSTANRSNKTTSASGAPSAAKTARKSAAK